MYLLEEHKEIWGVEESIKTVRGKNEACDG